MARLNYTELNGTVRYTMWSVFSTVQTLPTDADERAGLVDVEWYLRGPHAGRAETTQRLYVIGRKPA